MSITDELRKAFDQCTYKAGVAPDEFDTVWITKICALSMLDDIDAAFEAGHSRAVEYGKKIGRGTCQVDTTENWLPAERYHRCKHCGAFFAVLDASGDIPTHYCPNCGRRVVDE